MLSTWKRAVLIVTLLVILTGCSVMPSVPQRPVTITGTPEPYPCTHFADAHWKEFRFGLDTQDEVIAAVGRIWELGPEEIRSHQPAQFHPLPRLSWEVKADGVRYFAIFYENGTLKEIDYLTAPYWQEENNRVGLPLTFAEFRSHTGSYPTLRQVIDCFGAPEFYSAYWVQEAETGELNFALWYVDLGLIFSHVSYSAHHRQRPLPPPFPHGLSMHFATMLPGGDVAKMVTAHYEFDAPNKKYYVLCIIKPWPGSIEDLEAEPERIGYDYFSLPSDCNVPTQKSGVDRLNSRHLQ